MVRGTWNGVYACTDFGGVRVAIRLPRLSDAPAWSAARDDNDERVAAAFPSRRTRLDFVERCVRLRRAAGRGLAFPGVIIATAQSRSAVLGEVGLDDVDDRTRSGEVSAWTARDLPGPRVAEWALAAVLDHAFRGPRPLRRAVAPLASTNPGGRDALRRLGFHLEATLTGHRAYAGRAVDHEIWVLQNTSGTRAAVRARSEDPRT